MSHPDPYAYIRAILTTESSVARRHENEMKRIPLVITISRDYGALGEAIAEKALPFPVKTPNAETQAALDEVRAGKGRRFNTVHELLESLHGEKA